MKKKILIVAMAAVLCLSAAACGKESKKANTKASTTEGKETSEETSEDGDEKKSDSTEEETTEGDTDNDWTDYSTPNVRYDLPMMHTYKTNYSRVNDSSDIWLAMSQAEDSIGTYKPCAELENILESIRESLFLDLIKFSDADGYVIQSQEEYTTKNGIKGIKYEGEIVRDSLKMKPLYFYAFVFNMEDGTYQYTGLSSDQLVGSDESEYDFEAIKEKIKTTMDKSIDTIRDIDER